MSAMSEHRPRFRSRFQPASLRWRLLGLVTVATLIVWVMAGVLSYQQSGHELRELLDTQMDKSARMLLAQAQFNEQHLDNLLTNMEALRGPRVRRDEIPIEFQIGRADGSVLVRSQKAPAAPLSDAVGFSEIDIGNRRWRSLILSTVNGDYRIQVLQSIHKRDRQVLEMASQAVIPFFVSACSVSLGLCWKSGIAAEVIGIPDGSVGELLYNAKIYLQTGELLAWTVVIVAVSALFERVFLFLLGKIFDALEHAV